MYKLTQITHNWLDTGHAILYISRNTVLQSSMTNVSFFCLRKRNKSKHPVKMQEYFIFHLDFCWIKYYYQDGSITCVEYMAVIHGYENHFLYQKYSFYIVYCVLDNMLRKIFLSSNTIRVWLCFDTIKIWAHKIISCMSKHLICIMPKPLMCTIHRAL